MQLKFKKRS